jgi:hypothetical protein
MHDFFTAFGKTRVFVQKKPEGYGLVCHRVIREICKAVGIKDIYAKVEGSTKNVQHVAKAFMVGLLQQVIAHELCLEYFPLLYRFSECFHLFTQFVVFRNPLKRLPKKPNCTLLNSAKNATIFLKLWLNHPKSRQLNPLMTWI